MNLYEYQGKELFQKAGIPVQVQKVVQTVDDAVQAAKDIGGEVVLKAQVLAGGRGKAGGVKLAATEKDVRHHASNILGMSIKGITVEQLLVTRAVPIEKEYYLGIALDRNTRQLFIMASSEGGVDIEDLAESSPEKIIKFPIHMADGIDSAKVQSLIEEVFPSDERAQAKTIIDQLYETFVQNDCSLVEINPLARVQGKLEALDAKVVIDDNALYRHDDLAGMKNSEEYSSDEEEARENGLSFVGMDGDIGCIVNGAGLAMATMDLIKLAGGNPANFLDVGGSSNPDKVVAAIRIILRNPNVRAILLNIFGGITRCDDIARGLISATEQLDVSVPLVIRLVGTNQQEGTKLLEEKGFAVGNDLSSSVEKVVRMGK